MTTHPPATFSRDGAPSGRARRLGPAARALTLLAIPLLAAILLSPFSLYAQYPTDVGYAELQAELGAATPTGSSVSVNQTEASDGQGDYLPDSTNAEFAGKTLNAISGASGVSAHATTVGQYYYGSITSTTPGIGTIDVYNAIDWLESNLLNFGSSSLPLRETRAVENHSWIGTIDSGGPDDLEALERFDYAMQTSNFLGVAGLNNGSGSSIPQLLASAYDSISVGLTDGQHSTGTTTVNGSGRVKPEIVAPQLETSFATPMVASAGALLRDVINGNSAYANAANNAALKAILLAGATKSQIPGWSRTPTQPLDSHYGAGQLNIYDSYHILTAGQQASSSSSMVRSRGWDYSATTASGKYYYFQIAAGDSGSNFSALLTWNVKIKTRAGAWQNVSSTLPHLSLSIYAANNFTVGSLVDSSISSLDNVQHLYEPSLPPGGYALEVTADTTGVSYGLAWHSLPTLTIAATFPDAYEQGLTPGNFVITRAGEVTDPLIVQYTIAGTAVNGSDYVAIPSSATIPAGSSSVAIAITPIAHSAPEGDLSATLTLAGEYSYSIGGTGEAAVTIHDLPYNDWAVANFPPSELGNPSVVGPSADPDGDGIPNLLEYALNLNPNVPGQTGLPTISLGANGEPALTYTQVIAASDITYTVQLSTDLVSWSAGSTTVSQVVNQGATQLVTVASQLPLGAYPRQFLRLVVSGM